MSARPVDCIADVNVLLPLMIDGHAHESASKGWWDGCTGAAVGVCLPVHMALLRLLTNSRVMGSGTLRPAQAWSAVQCLLDDPRVVVVAQMPKSHAKFWQENIARREPTPDLWTDAWLAASAQAHDCEMVTFDRGFRSFPKLKLRLLDAVVSER